jgi:DNA-directed RNA polymerase specialized sigma subunit
MSMIEIQKLDKKKKELAQTYYLANYSLEDIANRIGTDLATIRFYVFGENGSGSNENCWFQLKKRLGPASVAAFVKDKISSLELTSGLALNLINENLRRIEAQFKADQDFLLTVDDTKKLAGILSDMDKIIRLESGQATQIIENVGLSRAEAIRLLSDDPFAQAIEVDDGDWSEIDESSLTVESDREDTIKGYVVVGTPWR